MSTLDEVELLRALFDASSDAVLIADDHGVIRQANPASERLFGFTVTELVGQSIELLVPTRFARHREMRGAFMTSPKARSMGSGLALVGRHKDGSEVAVDIVLTPIEHGSRHWVAATVRDMRGRVHAVETLRVQATALRSAANGVVITDRAGTITWVNAAACVITGYSTEELVGQHTRILKSNEHRPDFYAELWKTVTAGQTWSGTIVNRRKDGSLYREEQTIAPVVDEHGGVSHFIAIKQDVTDRYAAEQALAKTRVDLAARVAEIESLNAKLRDQAIRDPLTGLFNRRFFHETIARDVSAAARKREPLAILALDLDDFKRVNDLYGHAVGDAVLVELGAIIEKCFRASDIACRFGGEEFVVVLPGATVELAAKRAEDLRAAFASTPFATDQDRQPPLRATVSVGVSALHVGREGIEDALARADAALYEAKRKGRNRVVIAEADERESSKPPDQSRPS